MAPLSLCGWQAEGNWEEWEDFRDLLWKEGKVGEYEQAWDLGACLYRAIEAVPTPLQEQ